MENSKEHSYIFGTSDSYYPRSKLLKNKKYILAKTINDNQAKCAIIS